MEVPKTPAPLPRHQLSIVTRFLFNIGQSSIVRCDWKSGAYHYRVDEGQYEFLPEQQAL